MSKKSLVRHNRISRVLRDSGDGGGGGGTGTGEGGTGGTGGTGGGGGDGKNDPPATKSDSGEALDPETGRGLGFPAETPLEQMREAERTAYWRNMAKIKQREADKVKDYDQQKADAEKWREAQRQQQTPAEQQIEAAKLEGKKEAAKDSAMASLRAILSSRGKSESDISDLLEFVSPDRFVTAEGGVDTKQVTTYADKLAGTSSSPGGSGFGQGRYEQTSTSRSAAGLAEAEKRFGKKS